jgi:lysozyme-like protein
MDVRLQLRRFMAALQTRNSKKVDDVTLAKELLKWFEPADAITMFAIAGAESGYRVRAKNVDKKHGQEDYGIFQINEIHDPDPGLVYDIEYNVIMARKIFDRQGFSAWVAYDRGKHEAFLDRARKAVASAQGTEEVS